MAEKPLTDSINALTAYINEVTGETDTNLSDAVATLVDGYGGISPDDLAVGADLGDIVLKETTREIVLYSFAAKKLKSITGSNVITIRGQALELSTVEVVDFPRATGMGTAAFRSCNGLVKANLPKLSSVPTQGFYGCSAMTSINIQSVRSIANQAFKGCNSLRILKLPSCTGIGGGNNFLDCSNLTDIYLPNDASTYTGAPWGATNATIHYNTVFDENGEPIIE